MLDGNDHVLLYPYVKYRDALSSPVLKMLKHVWSSRTPLLNTGTYTIVKCSAVKHRHTHPLHAVRRVFNGSILDWVSSLKQLV